MEFTSIVENYNTPLWTFHMKVPEPIARVFIIEGDRRVVCRLNDRLEFQCAIMPNGDSEFFILLNKKIRDTLKLQLGNTVQVSLRKDDSEYGLPMPEEFKAILDSDPDGNALFHALTPGKQRTLLHMIGTAKHPDVRIHRGLVILEHLKITDNKINFRQLTTALKNKHF